MAHSRKPTRGSRPGAQVPPEKKRPGPRIVLAVIAVILVAAASLIALGVFPKRPDTAGTSPPSPAGSTNTNPSNPHNPVANAASSTNTPALPRLEVKQAVMVTVELDFGPTVPSIADALRQIERRHQPEDGQGRVFSILDAYGEPTADGKKLHMSMHVSSEKLGVGSLVFRRTGEVLWSNRIVPAADGSTSVSPTGLTILLDDGAGHPLTIDGSTGPASMMQATLKETGQLVEQAWPEGTQREITFLYSACGCPVKVKCQRSNNRLVRISESPVIFPDDPAALTIINQLMGW
jgi:hypothetical protein